MITSHVPEPELPSSLSGDTLCNLTPILSSSLVTRHHAPQLGAESGSRRFLSDIRYCCFCTELADVDAVRKALTQFVEVEAHQFIIGAVFETQQIGVVRQCLCHVGFGKLIGAQLQRRLFLLLALRKLKPCRKDAPKSEKQKVVFVSCLKMVEINKLHECLRCFRLHFSFEHLCIKFLRRHIPGSQLSQSLYASITR